MLRDILAIATAGEHVGQVNGLAAYQVGDEIFGVPARITATTRLGDGQVVDIQRETQLGGPVHAKGVLILSSFLAARYSRFQPHSIIGSLVFEQTYGLVEGDSASLAELVALLTSIGDVPVRQCLAMTGSVDQFGNVQAIGAVNEKIEGFFDLCAARGLDGTHGVVIPESNVAQLMLREDVIAAVAAGRFALHAVGTVDDALEVLTGWPRRRRRAERRHGQRPDRQAPARVHDDPPRRAALHAPPGAAHAARRRRQGRNMNDCRPIASPVLAVLDDAAAGSAALELSSTLARALQRELSVVYVESARSLVAAALPFTQVLSHSGSGWVPLLPADVEQGFRAHAARLRELAERIAVRDAVSWSLRVVRGSLPGAAIDLYAESDLLLLAASPPPWSPGERLAHRPRRRPVVAVLAEGSAAGQRALVVASRLAQALGRRARVDPPRPRGESASGRPAGVRRAGAIRRAGAATGAASIRSRSRCCAARSCWSADAPASWLTRRTSRAPAASLAAR